MGLSLALIRRCEPLVMIQQSRCWPLIRFHAVLMNWSTRQSRLTSASISRLFLSLTAAATRAFFFGEYENKSSCELAEALKTQRVLLLAGADSGYLRESTLSLQPCFSIGANLEAKTDLPLTGFTLASATGEQGEAYDRPVIDFFARILALSRTGIPACPSFTQNNQQRNFSFVISISIVIGPAKWYPGK